MAIWYPNERPLNLPPFPEPAYERFLMRLYLALAIAAQQAAAQPDPTP